RQRFKCLTANSNSTTLRTVRTEQHIDHRGFSASRFANNGGHTFISESHIYILQNVTLAVVGEGDIPKLNFVSFCQFFTPNRIGLFKKRDDLLSGRCAVHSNMERRAKGTQRQEEIHRNENEEQCCDRRQIPKYHREDRHSNTET